MSKNTVKPGLTAKRRSRSRRRRGTSVGVLVLRFVSGRELDGRRHGNGTFWSAGTRRVGVPPYLITWRWWALAAGWQRAGVRLAGTAAVLLLLAGVVAR